MSSFVKLLMEFPPTDIYASSVLSEPAIRWSFPMLSGPGLAGISSGETRQCCPLACLIDNYLYCYCQMTSNHLYTEETEMNTLISTAEIMLLRVVARYFKISLANIVFLALSS